MRTIFIIISKDVMRRNLLETPFWPLFVKETPDVRKVLIVEEEETSRYEEMYSGENIIIKGFKREIKGGLFGVAIFMARNCLNTHSAKYFRMIALTRKEVSWPRTYLKAFLANTLVRTHWYKAFVRKMVTWFVKSNQVKDLYEEFSPELVFTPSMIDNEFDIPIAAEAKRREIRLVGMVRSWDNMTSHSLLAVTPDRFLLQNKFLKDIAKGEFQNIKESKVPMDIIGLPHYDLYKNPKKYLVPRDEFLKEIGVDPNKKFILLGGSDLHKSENTLPETLNDLIEKGKIEESAQVVFRIHPRSMFTLEEYKIDTLKHIIADSAFVEGGKVFSDTEKFINMLYHADILIHTASTLGIDGAVFDTPVITINFDGPRVELPYWLEVGRNYDTFNHFERFNELNGSQVPTSPDQLVQAINDYFEDPSIDKDGRKRILDEFVEPFDGKASDRLSDILVSEMNKINT